MKASTTLILTASIALILSAGCQTAHHTPDGVMVAYGNTTVEVDTNPAPLPEIDYQRATSEDVVVVMTELACQYPEGPSDLERQAFTSLMLESRGVDPDSFKSVLVTAIADIRFAERLEDGMSQRCPAQLEAIFAEARLR